HDWLRRRPSDSLRRRRSDRQGDREGRAGIRRALNRDMPAQHLAEVLGDGEPKPGASVAPCGRRVGLAEGLEQTAELLLAHADAGIADDERQLARSDAQFEGNAAVPGELAGIA